jgi:hypothetical protein
MLPLFYFDELEEPTLVNVAVVVMLGPSLTGWDMVWSTSG